jgi:hypothetical protein
MFSLLPKSGYVTVRVLAAAAVGPHRDEGAIGDGQPSIFFARVTIAVSACQSKYHFQY